MVSFLDEVPSDCRVEIEGCSVELACGAGGDMRLGAIVLELLTLAGENISGLEVEGVGQHFTIDQETLNRGSFGNKITVFPNPK